MIVAWCSSLDVEDACVPVVLDGVNFADDGIGAGLDEGALVASDLVDEAVPLGPCQIGLA